MEKIPGPRPNTIESRPERILTREQVLEVLSQYAEGLTPGRELSDEKGVYLLEAERQGENEGETTEYQYMRKGDHGRQNLSTETAISVIYYDNGVPIGGERLAILDETTGAWRTV